MTPHDPSSHFQTLLHTLTYLYFSSEAKNRMMILSWLWDPLKERRCYNVIASVTGGADQFYIGFTISPNIMNTAYAFLCFFVVDRWLDA